MAAVRFVVGIDLGTTHTVVARADAAGGGAIEIFAIDQLVGPAEAAARPLLASCLYVPLESELTAAARGEGPGALPGADAPYVAGEYARRRGAEVPGRVVSSAKSWLCHPGVDRTEAILPWGGPRDAADLPGISPVDAQAQVLRHVRRAWDRAHPGAPLAEQDVVLTVPASFDEAARELTLEAVRRAGLAARLLEEPQAAFYDWMHRAGEAGLRELADEGGGAGALVLVCDVGGGTTDLSLIRLQRGARGTDDPRVERVAVGDHLLLGGDNMDLALAHACEPRLSGGERLAPSRFAQLVAACRAAKERLLGDAPPESVTVTLLGEGSRLLGGARSTQLTRSEAEHLVLDGFLPRVGADARPERARSALVAFGLPYARDAAITRHLAQFLARHGEQGVPARPGAVVLNGGVFHARAAVTRLTEVMASWGGPAPRVLPHADPDLAVARGAAAYALALRGKGRTIGGGSARAYYVGVGSADASTGERRGPASGATPTSGEGPARFERAVCLVPRGAAEGVRYRAPQRLLLTVGRAARFELFASSDDRGHAPGDVVAMDEEHFARLPPIFAALPAEGLAREAPVALEGELTPLGTLDLACVELSDDTGASMGKRHHLAFRLRGGSGADHEGTRALDGPPSAARPSVRAQPRRIDEARALLARVYGKSRDVPTAREVKDLLRDLERVLGERATWTTETARELFDTLAPLARGRRRSVDHERQFWSLAGFALRPGFGFPGDDARVALLAPLVGEGVAHATDARVWQQHWIAWRRVAGGLDETAQIALRDVADPHLEPGALRRKPRSPRPEALDDLLALASWLERVPPARKVELGDWVVQRMWTDPDARLREALGRLAARSPVYASAHAVIAPADAERFVDELLREKWATSPASGEAALKIATMTGDRARELPERLRREVARRLTAVGATPERVAPLFEVVARTDTERAALFGESLPVGLRLA